MPQTCIAPSIRSSEPAESAAEHQHVSLAIRIANLVGVVGPFIGLIVACVFLWGWGITWVHLGILIGMYLATGLGVTIGYHRLFTHKSFETSAVMKFIWAMLGSMAMEGPLLKWVAQHRKHHQHSDREDDPHSPHLHGEKFRGLVLGLWHAHVGWIFNADSPDLMRYVPDLEKSKMLRVVSDLFPVWVLAGLLIPAGLGWLLTLHWTGALLGMLWGGLVRIFFVHHITWSINSVCHLWGTAPFKSHDHSKNNLVFGILAMGEGWHNNHHAFPTSARHGLRWSQFDLSWYVIKLMTMMRVAWDARVPSPEAIAQKLKTPA